MQIKKRLENWIKETLDLDKTTSIALVHPKEISNGDYTLIVANDAKDVFEKLGNNRLEEIEKIELIEPRFINVFLSKDFFEKEISSIGEDYGKNDLLNGQKIFIEHTQPNPFKEFHIGHLMNNAIGEAVSRILENNGAEAKTCSYHGDVGLHVAKTIWGKMQKPELNWGQAYSYGSQSGEGYEQEIIEINKNVYNKSDDKINSLYEQGKKESLERFQSAYNQLDSCFDFNFFESESGEIGKKIVEENIGRVFEEGDEGAVVFRGENFEPKTHTRVFLNKEGLPTYEAKEVGLAKIKKENFDYDTSITVTANEQDSFFKVVEVAIGEVFPDRKGKLKHLSHGMLKLPGGKMSSRTGNVITATALIEDVKNLVKEKTKDRSYSESEKEEIAEIVAIGAIKYSILRQAIGGDIIFDFDKSLSFEGDSGPYLQYAYVRTKSVLEKAPLNILESIKSIFEGGIERPTDFPITEIEKLAYRFPEVVERAGKEYAPHHLVTYLVELAGSFNSFYAKEKIIDDTDPVSPYKIALTKAVSRILKNGLHLLGIKVPEKM